MAIGSIGGWYTSGSIYGRQGMSGWYTSGSLYSRHSTGAGGWYVAGSMSQRFAGTYADTLNQQALDNLDSQVSAAATSIYAQLADASQQTSVFAARQLQDRVLAAAQASSDGLDAAKSGASVLDVSV